MTCRFVFQIMVQVGKEDVFLEHWHNSSIAIQHMAGAQGTRLHKKRGDENIYFAIAEWKSEEARIAAFQRLAEPANPHGQEMRRWPKAEEVAEWTLLGAIDEVDSVFPQLTATL